MFDEKIKEMNENLEPFKPNVNPNKRVYTCKEIQDILGVSRTTIYHLIESKVFHTVRVGGQYRISKISFDKWLDSQSEINKNVNDANEKIA